MAGKKAYVFPGQGSQFCGMAKSLYDNHAGAKKMLERANELLGFRITDIMFGEDSEALKATNVTQPAVFLHSTILASCLEDFAPDMVAGHSLGEFSALASSGALSFDDALNLVKIRAEAMQKACESNPGGMAAIIGMSDEQVVEICKSIDSHIVVAANFNSPGQVVISGENDGIDLACEKFKAAGAKRALRLPVGGAFHSPLMMQARDELAKAIEAVPMAKPVCPIYQNVNGLASSDPDTIKKNLLSQLTAPVLWSQSVCNMICDGASSFVELGPGTTLQGLIKRIAATPVEISSLTELPQTGI